HDVGGQLAPRAIDDLRWRRGARVRASSGSATAAAPRAAAASPGPRRETSGRVAPGGEPASDAAPGSVAGARAIAGPAGVDARARVVSGARHPERKAEQHWEQRSYRKPPFHESSC